MVGPSAAAIADGRTARRLQHPIACRIHRLVLRSSRLRRRSCLDTCSSARAKDRRRRMLGFPVEEQAAAAMDADGAGEAALAGAGEGAGRILRLVEILVPERLELLGRMLRSPCPHIDLMARDDDARGGVVGRRLRLHTASLPVAWVHRTRTGRGRCGTQPRRDHQPLMRPQPAPGCRNRHGSRAAACRPRPAPAPPPPRLSATSSAPAIDAGRCVRSAAPRPAATTERWHRAQRRLPPPQRQQRAVERQHRGRVVRLRRGVSAAWSRQRQPGRAGGEAGMRRVVPGHRRAHRVAAEAEARHPLLPRVAHQRRRDRHVGEAELLALVEGRRAAQRQQQHGGDAGLGRADAAGDAAAVVVAEHPVRPGACRQRRLVAADQVGDRRGSQGVVIRWKLKGRWKPVRSAP